MADLSDLIDIWDPVEFRVHIGNVWLFVKGGPVKLIVPGGQAMADALNAAFEAGYSKGYENGTFDESEARHW